MILSRSWVLRILGLWCALVALLATIKAFDAHGFDLTMQRSVAWYEIVAIIVPGFPLSSWAQRAGWFARLSASWACGIPLQLLGWWAAVSFDQTSLLWWIPLGLGVIATVVLHRPLIRSFKVPRYQLPWWTSPVLLASWLFVLLRFASVWRFNPGGDNAQFLMRDLYWHQAINAQARWQVPLTDPQALNETLNYHWFSNAHVGAIARATEIDLTWLTIIAWEPAAFAATLGLTLGVASYLTRGGAAGPLAVVFVVLPPAYLTNLAFQNNATDSFILLSPSHMFALPLTVAFVWAVVVVLRQPRIWRFAVAPALALLILVLPGAKISTLPTVVCGLLAAFVAALVIRRHRLITGVLCASVLLILAFSYPIFGGGGGGTEFSWLGSFRQTELWYNTRLELGGAPYDLIDDTLASVAALMMLNFLFALVGLAAFRPRDPFGWFYAGMVSSAIGVLLVSVHPGSSELYFPRGIQPLLATSTAAGLVLLWRRTGWQLRGRAVGALATAGLGVLTAVVFIDNQGPETVTLEFNLFHLRLVAGIILGFLLVWLLVGRRLASALVATALVFFSLGQPIYYSRFFDIRNIDGDFIGNILENRKYPSTSINPPELEAARWARDNLPRDAVLATNVHCAWIRNDPHCDARGFWVSAFTERQVLLGGWAYTNLGRSTQGVKGLNHVFGNYPDGALYRQNQQAFSNPTRTVLNILRERGVTHLFGVERAREMSGDIIDYCEPVFINERVVICSLETEP